MKTLLLWFSTLLIATNIFAGGRPTSIADTIAPDYNRAVDLCLYHQYAEAEILLRQIAGQANHPNRDAARLLLLDEVYFWRGHYGQYVQFADSTGSRPNQYASAKLLAGQPASKFGLSSDSTNVPFSVRMRSHIVVQMLVNGKPKKFIVDTGCQRTVISNRLGAELGLTKLLDVSVENFLHQSVPASIAIFDSIKLGGLFVKNLPILQAVTTSLGVDGFLGWDVLRHLCFTINYPSRTLTLRKPVANADVQHNLLGGGRPLMVLKSATGNQLSIFFDSGSNDRLIITPVGLPKIGPYKTGKLFYIRQAIGGKTKLYFVNSAKELTIKINDKPVRFRKTELSPIDELICSVYKDGIIGSRPFTKGRLTIDFVNNHFDYVK